MARLRTRKWKNIQNNSRYQYGNEKNKNESNTPWACAKVIKEDKIVDLWNQLGKRKPDTQKGNGGRPTRQIYNWQQESKWQELASAELCSSLYGNAQQGLTELQD